MDVCRSSFVKSHMQCGLQKEMCTPFSLVVWECSQLKWILFYRWSKLSHHPRWKAPNTPCFWSSLGTPWPLVSCQHKAENRENAFTMPLSFLYTCTCLVIFCINVAAGTKVDTVKSFGAATQRHCD